MTSYSAFKSKVKKNIEWPIPDCAALADALLNEFANALDKNEHLTSARLFQIAFGSFRSAMLMANAGSISQVPIICRHAIESALYSFLFSKRPEFENLWWRREEDSKAKRDFRDRKSGAMATIRNLLREHDPELAKRLKGTQDHLIDFGAHPNVYQLIGASDYDENETVESYKTLILGNENERDSKYLMVTGSALELAEIYRLTWPERFDLLLGSQKVEEIVGQMRLFAQVHYNETKD